MRKNVIALILIALLSAGCVPMLIGAAGVVTGYVAFKDSVAGNIDGTFNDIWSGVKTVMENHTEIIKEDDLRGTVRSSFQDNDVTVKVIAFTDNAYKLKVTCRRMYKMAANLELAQDLFTRIIKEIVSIQTANQK